MCDCPGVSTCLWPVNKDAKKTEFSEHVQSMGTTLKVILFNMSSFDDCKDTK